MRTMTDWWDSSAWHAYEALHDGPPGRRAALLASAAWQTRVVDLSQNEAALWRGVRRSYHALINRLTHEYELAPAGWPLWPRTSTTTATW